MRRAALQDFLDALKAAFTSSATSHDVDVLVAKLFAALENVAPQESRQPVSLSVCIHLPAAFEIVRSALPDVRRLAATLETIAPYLEWKERHSGGPHSSTNWPGGHANAVIVGEGGLEDRSDIAVGASLLAPHVRYPDHTHAPEEAYIVLAPGRFRHGASDWFNPGVGGTLHNTSNVVHAMASDDTPLLAIWCHLAGRKRQTPSHSKDMS